MVTTLINITQPLPYSNIKMILENHPIKLYLFN